MRDIKSLDHIRPVEEHIVDGNEPGGGYLEVTFNIMRAIIDDTPATTFNY